MQSYIYMYLYMKKHNDFISKSGIETKKHFIPQSTWSQIILSDYQINNDLATCASVTIDDFSEIGSYLP